MKIDLATNEAINVNLEQIKQKLPNCAKSIKSVVLRASSFDDNLKKLLSIKLFDSKGKVLKFIIACFIRHRNLMWGMINSFLYSDSKLDGFIYLKHNFEFVAVAHTVIGDIEKNMNDEKWREIEIRYLYNVKSIVEYCKKSGKKDAAEKFCKIGKQKSISFFIDKMSDEFQQQYAIVNALSHPNNYTTLGEEFPYIKVQPIDYLIEQTNYLQDMVEKSVDELLVKII